MQSVRALYLPNWKGKPKVRALLLIRFGWSSLPLRFPERFLGFYTSDSRPGIARRRLIGVPWLRVGLPWSLVRCISPVTWCQGNLQFVDFFPLSFRFLVVGYGQKNLQATARGDGLLVIHDGIIPEAREYLWRNWECKSIQFNRMMRRSMSVSFSPHVPQQVILGKQVE